MPRAYRPKGDERDALYASKRWRDARKRAIAAAGGRCERCGGGGRLTVHHVLPVRDALAIGADPCDPALLEVLCVRCHGGVDGGRASRPREDGRFRKNPFLSTVLHRRGTNMQD